MQANKQTKMQYRSLGKASGLRVSVISLGFMGESDQDKINELVKRAYEAGVNFFDNAEAYGYGKVEVLIGNAIKNLGVPREDLVISTKIFWGGEGPNRKGLSKKHLVEGTNASLKRLQLDYVDLLLAHRPDFDIPLEETCRGFDYLVKSGKTLHWGTSQWPAKRIWQAIAICEKYKLEKPIVEQCEYNMLIREKMENDYVELFDEYGMGTTVYSPLCGGILAGRYNRGIPEDSRWETMPPMFKFVYHRWLAPENIEKTREMCLKFEEFAKELGATMAQLALAWVIKNNDVSTALMGASKLSQLEDSLGALDLLDKLTPEVLERLENLLGTRPTPPEDPRTWKFRPHRR